MGTVDKIARCKWPASADELIPQLKRHWLYEAGMLNRVFGDFVFKVGEDGITGADFADGAIPESALAVELQAQIGIDSGAVIVNKLANQVLTATAAARAKMADDFLATAKFGAEQVTTAKLATAVAPFGPPVGAIGKFAGESAPTNWLECTGASVLIADYPALFSAIGTYWGTAASGYFKLPDMRGYFSRGWAHGTTNDPDTATRTGGDHVGSVQAEGFKSHVHTVPGSPNDTAGTTRRDVFYTSLLASFSTASTSPTGTETRGKNKAVMFCIRAK